MNAQQQHIHKPCAQMPLMHLRRRLAVMRLMRRLRRSGALMALLNSIARSIADHSCDMRRFAPTIVAVVSALYRACLGQRAFGAGGGGPGINIAVIA